MAVIADPTGSMFNLWTPKNSIGAQLVNEHGTLSWNELMIARRRRGQPFYKKIFGWEPRTGWRGRARYTEWKLGDRSIARRMKPPMPGMPSVWGIYFATDDTDKTVETAKANGGTVFQEPMDIQPGRMAVLADPTGAMFSVIKMAIAGD